MAEGLTIITQRGNEAFLREIASRRHTLGQDALGRSPKEPKFQLVDDSLTLKDGTNEVVLRVLPLLPVYSGIRGRVERGSVCSYSIS